MARIPIPREDDPAIPEGTRQLLQTLKAARGRLHNVTRAMANHPEALRTFSALTAAVLGAGSSLTAKQAELAYSTATVCNNCYY
jgi:alkylhydroperoxidase family enzyme